MDVVTLIIAILGFVIALVSCVWQIATWFWSTARPRATMMHGIIVGPGTGTAMVGPIGKNGAPFPVKQMRRQGYNGPEIIGIEVVNHGRAPMTVTKFGLKHESGVGFVPIGEAIGPTFPHRIEAGASQSWFAPIEMIREGVSAASDVWKTGRAVSIEATLATGKTIKTRQSMQI
ncbi:phosphoribosylamine--glycine ligase [Kribbella jiaozuonensis]|uniref:Phosphoribosylamine--glycine ligase n=1 Tax=Kribbella jiaozuonensis TaxID=2575441 RepID=A0A4U3LKE3_9ACTN|nr:phosphoribosylamine--glycine ligase [Kribbella jiaozuonensis]TKK76060.1 phosphoribosylamine--glycine ligase [Kribbella jiaozuonensis]